MSDQSELEIYGDVDVNQAWRSKRGPWRKVEITDLFIGRGRVGYANVRRNSSRRTQAISLPVLRRDYERVE